MRYAACVGLIQIRGVSEETHRRLKARAALEGQSLSEYLRLELEQLASLPTLDELLDRVGSRPPVTGEPGAEAVRAERDARGAV